MKYPLKRENPDFSGVGSSFISLISIYFLLFKFKKAPKTLLELE